MSGESGEPRSDLRSMLGFLAVLATVVGLLAWGVVRGQGDDGAAGADRPAGRATTESSAAASSPTALPEVEVTAPPPATRRRCRGGHVALTFDDGPAETTGEILDQLAAAGARATFFNLGAREEQHIDLVRRTVAEGHDLGNHGYDHTPADELSPEDVRLQLLGTNQIHEQLTGRQLPWFRPALGRTSDEVRATARSMGLRRVLWTVGPGDERPARSVGELLRRVDRAGDGDVVLLHDDAVTARALPRALERLAARGLCSGRLAVGDTRVPTRDGTFHRIAVVRWE